jgi:hypothetical protein
MDSTCQLVPRGHAFGSALWINFSMTITPPQLKRKKCTNSGREQRRIASSIYIGKANKKKIVSSLLHNQSPPELLRINYHLLSILTPLE